MNTTSPGQGRVRRPSQHEDLGSGNDTRQVKHLQLVCRVYLKSFSYKMWANFPEVKFSWALSKQVQKEKGKFIVVPRLLPQQNVALGPVSCSSRAVYVEELY